MRSADLMGGYAAYATPNAVIKEMALSSVSQQQSLSSFSISIFSYGSTISLTCSVSIMLPEEV